MQVKRSSTLPRDGYELSTEELVALAQAGNRDAFDPLYRRYGWRVQAYANGRCGRDRALAEDVAAQVWVKAMTRIGQWRPRGRGDDDFVRWLFGMVRTAFGEAITAGMRELPATPASDKDFLWTEASGDADDLDADEYLGKQEMVARLHTEIGRLSPVCRDVVRMRLDGMGTAEIAQTTGLSTKQVGDAWRRAHVELRRRLVGRLDVDALCGQERDRLLELAQELPEVTREVALLRLEGMPMPQVAQATGMTRAQAHNAWRHAEDLLRKLMDDPDLARRPRSGRVAAWQKERGRLQRAVQELGPATQQVALLRLAGMTHSEIAAKTGRTPGGVGSTWRNALDQFTRTGLIAA